MERASIQDFRWHDLRHAFASPLAAAGVPTRTLRDLLGHTPAMTARYAHPAPDDLRAAERILERTGTETGTREILKGSGAPDGNEETP